MVLYPGLGVGHLTPMVELAKAFLHHGAAVTVALVEPPTKPPDFSGVPFLTRENTLSQSPRASPIVAMPSVASACCA